MTTPIAYAPTPDPLAAEILLACFDIDGTIMNSVHEVSTATRESFQFLAARGIKLALASGRPLLGIKNLLSELPISAPCSLFAGALLIDTGTGSILHEAPLSNDEVRELVAVCASEAIYLELYTQDAFYCDTAHHPYSKIHAEYLGYQPDVQSDLLSLSESVLYKGCLIVPANQQINIVRRLSRALPDCLFACSPGAAHPEIMFINVTSGSCSRTTTFNSLLSHFAIDATAVIAFGDGETDREFLSCAGIGVAMGTANDSVKAAAKYLTDSVDADGVHKALEHIFACSI